MKINVTKTYLPPLSEYNKYLEKIWKSGWVTNEGKLLLDLERKLEKYLDVKNLTIVSSGTSALQIILRALEINGEVITTPFSYVATTSSLVWEGCKPIFADIDPNTLCIDPAKVEKKITKDTKAILAVHIFGNPCNVEQLDKIAKKHRLKIIYDAAHAFGVKYKGKSILGWGDASILSFHATKIFHTVEGGAIVCKDPKIYKKIQYMRNFGHKGYEKYQGLGINAKESELHAAIGLLVLKRVNSLINKRKHISNYYDRLLSNTQLEKPVFSKYANNNYSFYPILFKNESQLKRVKHNLEQNQIFPRRYFYPSLTKLPYIKNQSCPISENISRRILCLPFYESLTKKQVLNIVQVIRKTI